MDDQDNVTDDSRKKDTKGKKSKAKAGPSGAARPKKTAAASSSSATEIYTARAQAECSHPEFKRHGNRRGSFATCAKCMARWRWDDTAWRQHGS